MKKQKTYGQSGVQGFFGNTSLIEYGYQMFYKFLPGYNFDGLNFVSKTATLKARKGNTKLKKDGFRIKSFYPRSIWVSLKSFWYGYMLNAIGLSNPGLEFMLKYDEWQKRSYEYFHISIQIESEKWQDIEYEINEICRLLNHYLPPSEYNYDIQMNDSCPNTEHGIGIDEAKVTETQKKLELFQKLMPTTGVFVKYNALIETQVLQRLKTYCKGYVISNTIPFGDKSSWIDWNRWFKDGKSPLPQRLGKPFEGGLSGKIMFPVLLHKIESIQLADAGMHIIAGGGIMSKKQVDILSDYSVVKGIALGTVALLRPWRLSSLINYTNKTIK